MRMQSLICLLTVCCLGGGASLQAGLATFDDLPAPPSTDSATGLLFANNSNDVYQGVTWDSRVTVVGDAYRVDPGTPGPLFGIPHSGNYFVTNGGVSNDGILLMTNQILREAWFGQNAYYGFGSGADQVTIHALHGTTVLDSIVFDLPAPGVFGQPGIMGRVDTSAFASLTGITGYRIDRREVGTLSGNWVADDFLFEGISPVAVPEPSTLCLLAIGLAARSLKRRQLPAYH